ncbi:HU family DNA-binding protein [uncultured Bacteroides sp.]|uniref:HU family DNA-binding protein n=1 Tax=uncultured Bacteroides sp. TaxID=162156 RepID=UPI002AAAE89D|nr:HU family DNA-binding protein [uncultured Bacteroides sp.]
MAIPYKFKGINDNLSSDTTKKGGVHPIVKSREQLDTRALARYIAGNNPLQRSQIELAINQTFNAIEKALSDGYTVSITDYGSFQLSAQFREDFDPEMPHRAESIEVKSVNFRASTKMKKRIGVAGFEKSER